jgi:cyanophycinase
VLLSAALWAWLLAANPSYTSFLQGATEDVTAPTRPGLVLMGGGGDVDEAFLWMIERSGGGDFVILRASGADGYNEYLTRLGKLDSVETLLFHSREAALDPEVVAKIERAEAIFIAGGDQARYYELWADTPLARAVTAAATRCPVGGTSAGLAVMGEQAFSARMGTLTSEQVLNDPGSPAVTLEPGLFQLEPLRGILTDSHFSQRERLGRLVAFLSRLWKKGKRFRGVGVDEATAVLVDGDGGRVVGKNAVTFVFPSVVPEKYEPLHWANVGVLRLSSGQSFRWADLRPAQKIQVRRGYLRQF